MDLREKISHRQNVVNQHFHPIDQQTHTKKSSAKGLQRREFGGCWSKFPMRRQGSTEVLRDTERKVVDDVSTHRGEGFSDSGCFTGSVKIQDY